MATLPGWVNSNGTLREYSLPFTNSFNDSRTKNKTPNWRVLKFVSPKPVLYYKRSIVSGYCDTRVSGSCYRQIGSNRLDYSFDFSFPDARLTLNSIQTFLDTYYPAVLNEANALFQKRLSDVKVQGIVEIGEGHKTLSMVKQRTQTMIDFIQLFAVSKRGLIHRARQFLYSRPSHIRHGKKVRKVYPKGDFKRLISDWNSAFLEFSFGWQPLAGALNDSMEVLVDHFIEMPPRLKVSAHSFMEKTISSLNVSQTMPYGVPLAYDLDYKSDLRLDVWVGGLLNPKGLDRLNGSDNALSLNRRFGLEFASIIPALYELTPYSFLLDYVSNLGDVINNLGGWLMFLESGYSYETTKLTVTPSIEISNWKKLYETSTSKTVINSILAVKRQEQSLIFFERKPTQPIDHVVKLQLETPSWGQLVKAASLLQRKASYLRI